MPKLFEDQNESDGSDGEEQLDMKVNEDYAKKYEKWRAGEELQKLKDKFGEAATFEDDDIDDDDDSDSESSSADEPELLANDKEWLRTLALIKAKDSRIYDPKFSVYKSTEKSEESNVDVSKDKKKNKKNGKKADEPMYLRDYERKMILEAEGKPVDDDDNDNRRFVDEEVPLPYNEEQRKLKESFKKFLDENSDEEEPLLRQKEKDDREKSSEEAAYLQWLKGQPDALVDPKEAKDLDPLRKYWNDPSLPDGERFLRDFIMQGAPSALSAGEKVQIDDDVDLVADEDEVERQTEFERKYNFRYEEPDPEFIKSYPRTISESLRKKDDSRAKKREELRKRKQQEEVERREELRQLKKLKREEIAEKIAKLKKIAGNEEDDGAFGNFKPEDLDADYDPEAHAKMLERVFNDDYYNVAEDVRPDIGVEDEDYAEDIKAEAGSDWEEGELDEVEGDQEPGPSNEVSNDAERPWRRKKSRALAELEKTKDKPIFNPEEKTFDEYLDEYYKLDYEDVVGGMPCRFKYRKVEPVDFGLDAKEILEARDKELNSWVSIKRVVQYRRPEDDLKDKKRYEQKAKNTYKKLKILPSLKKEEAANKPESDGTSAKQKTKGKQRKTKDSDPSLAGLTDDRLKAYGLEPKKFNYTKHRFIQQNAQSDAKSAVAGRKKTSKNGKARPVFA